MISQLVTALLIGCQDVNSHARLLCGECLGELGAVDPGRLDFSTSNNQGKGHTFVVRNNIALGQTKSIKSAMFLSYWSLAFLLDSSGSEDRLFLAAALSGVVTNEAFTEFCVY